MKSFVLAIRDCKMPRRLDRHISLSDPAHHMAVRDSNRYCKIQILPLS